MNLSLRTLAGLALLPTLGLIAPARADVTVTPIVTYVHVDGDNNRFRQDWWIKNDVTGGLDDLTISEALGGDWQLHAHGRAVFDDEDYALTLEIVKPDVGFLRAGYSQYRKYFDDTGGYYRFLSGASSFDLGRDLHLDIGSFYVELGLTLPNWPRIVLGYERRFKDGTKSMIEWGTAQRGSVARNILPASKNIDETVDIFKVELSHDIGAVHLRNDFRYERYDTKAVRLDDVQWIVTNAAPGKSVVVRESYEHDAFYNTFRMETHVSETVYWAVGYLFTTLDGEPGFAMDTQIVPAFGGTSSGTDKFWQINRASINQDSHVLNVSAMFGPYFKKSTYLYGGIQAEKTETDAFSDVDLRETSAPDEAGVITTRNDKDWFQERIGIRFVGIPFTTLYAEGKFDQGNVALYEEEVITGLANAALASETLLRYTDTDVTRHDYRVGFNSSPVRRVNVGGYYRRNERENRYHNLIDQEILLGTNGVADVENQAGYSAFIDRQELTTDEIGAKLTVRPINRVTVSLKYQLIATDFDTRFETATALRQTGNYDANVYTVSLSCTPVNRLYCTGLFSYRDTRTIAQDNRSAAVATYEGDGYSVIAAIGYLLDDKTDLRAEYQFSTADNRQGNSAAGLDLGADYERHGVTVTLTRQFKPNVSGRLRYGFFELDEASTGGVNDYTAHLISGSCVIRF